MTTLQTPPSTRSSPPARSSPRSAGRIATAVVLIISLICSGVMRKVAADRQFELVNVRGRVASRSTLGNMDSFALALLLGGLRGPLVMILWPAIENQKADHNLEDVDTMIEWVRLLQPEFDTVHLFQIWNKAYNLSVLMSSPANKYAVIMEAIDYAESVDRERPGDINILSAIASVYSGKLGSTTLAEFPFYGRQLREESMAEPQRKLAYPWDDHFARITKRKPILDDHNDIRADLVAPTRIRPSDLAPNAEWNDGAELQYLKQYAPFPYGVGPLALSYNYSRRAEAAQSVEGQKALQVGAMVIDSQPALNLRFWSEDDERHGRAAETLAFGLPLHGTKEQINETELKILPGMVPTDPWQFDAAIYYYSMAARTAADSIAAFERHISRPAFAMRRATYASHMAEMDAANTLDSADRDFLLAINAANPRERAKLLSAARDEYATASNKLERTALEYFIEEAAIGAPGVLPAAPTANVPLRQRVAELSDSQLDGVFHRSLLVADERMFNEHTTERADFGQSVERCRVRRKVIDAAIRATTQP